MSNILTTHVYTYIIIHIIIHIIHVYIYIYVHLLLFYIFVSLCLYILIYYVYYVYYIVWISRFRGVYRDLTAYGGISFWYYLKNFSHSVMSQRAPLLVAVGGILYLPLHFIVIAIIIVIITITFIFNIIFIIFIIIRIFITSSLLFLWGKLTVWFCFFQFLYLS